MTSEGGPAPNADATAWLDVPAKAHFSVRTIETGRELRFEGPGRVRACGDDVALVAEGSAVGLPGSGEAPGAEQWVATACGVARWASGVHRFTGARNVCKVQSSTGAMSLYVAEDVSAEEVPADGGAPPLPVIAAADAGAVSPAWRRVDGRHSLDLSGRGALDTPAAAKRALGACERASSTVQTLAVSLNSGDAAAPLPQLTPVAPMAQTSRSLGDLAADSVVARGLARAACAVAAVRVALAGSRAEDRARLDAASARWRAP